MPRPYGLTELQLVVNEAFRRGRATAKVRGILADTDYPHVEEILAAVGIEHPLNVPFDPKKRRSWHE